MRNYNKALVASAGLALGAGVTGCGHNKMIEQADSRCQSVRIASAPLTKETKLPYDVITRVAGGERPGTRVLPFLLRAQKLGEKVTLSVLTSDGGPVLSNGEAFYAPTVRMSDKKLKEAARSGLVPFETTLDVNGELPGGVSVEVALPGQVDAPYIEIAGSNSDMNISIMSQNCLFNQSRGEILNNN